MALAIPTRTRFATGPISAVGEAESWKAVGAAALSVFDSFVAFNDAEDQNNPPKIGASFERFRDGDLRFTDEAMWQRFASYLVDSYVKPPGTKGAGSHIGCGTAIGYFNVMLEKADGRAGQGERARQFFSCRDSQSRSASRRWLLGVRDNMFGESTISVGGAHAVGTG